MKRRDDPNQILIDWTARIGDASKRKPEDAAPSEQPSPTKRRRHKTPARFPVPDPLPAAVEKGVFGYDDNEDPIKPGPREVRAITEHHAERMIELLHELARSHPRTPEGYRQKDLLDGEYKSKLAMYAEDFGEVAANQLDAYVRAQAERDARGR